MKRLWLAAALAGAAGCADPYVVKVDANGPLPVVTSGHTRVEAGRTVRVVVNDSVWGNEWTVAVSDTALPAISRSALFMSGEISRLAQWFAPAAEPTARVTPMGIAPLSEWRGCGDRNQATLQEDLETADSELEDAAKAANKKLAELGTGEYPAALDFAFNGQLRDFAARLAADTLPAHLERTLLAHAARAPEPPARLDSARLESLMSRSGRYLVMVRTLAASVPDDTLEGETSLPAKLRQLMSLRARHAELVRERARISTCPGAAAPISSPGTPLNSFAGGFEVARLLHPDTLRALDTVYVKLSAVDRDVRRMAAALNVLPYLIRTPNEQEVFERAFPGDKAVTFQISRRPRFGTFVATSVPAGDTAKPAARAPAALSVAHRMEVLPRYRFHVGAGAVWSPLRTRAYETTEDTEAGATGVRIRESSETPNQLFPSLLLAYNVYPFSGRSYDVREYAAWPRPRSLGLSVQAGVSLLDPTENFFVGVGTEPVPGVHLGFGRHFAHVQTTRYASGDFVSDADAPATSKQWRGRWGAWSLGVDANVFFSTVGALFK